MAHIEPHHGFSTRCIHAGQTPDPVTGAVMPPVSFSSTYAQSSPGEHAGFEYSRSTTPPVTHGNGALPDWKARNCANPMMSPMADLPLLQDWPRLQPSWITFLPTRKLWLRTICTVEPIVCSAKCGPTPPGFGLTS